MTNNILVCGYYYRCNLGDDLFMQACRDLFPAYHLNFIDIEKVNAVDVALSQHVIVGPGDVLNDWFASYFYPLLKNSRNYKMCLGAGVSYTDCLQRDYIQVFDDIYLRGKKDLPILSRKVGSQHCGAIPDIVFSYNIELIPDKREEKKVACFLVGSLLESKAFMFTLNLYLRHLLELGYRIELLTMHAEEDDKINQDVIETFAEYGEQIIYHSFLSQNEFLYKLNYFSFAICVRFHAHILCTMYGIPFVSLPITRKCKIYNMELPAGCDHHAMIKYDATYKVINFDYKQAVQEFTYLTEHRQQISEKLMNYSALCKNFFSSNFLQKRLSNAKKREIFPSRMELVNYHKIHDKYKNLASDSLEGKMSGQEIDNLVDHICYDLTLDATNEYIYGMRQNIRKEHDLLEMIKWVYEDYQQKKGLKPLNLNFIKQDSYRGIHRAGWQYAADSLYCAHHYAGTYVDIYCDRTFGWGSKVLETDGVIPYTNSWIGFFHHTFESEFSIYNNMKNVINNPLFAISLMHCKGIFTLSEYLAKQIRQALSDLGYDNILVEVLRHPTIFPKEKFTVEKYMNNEKKRLVNIGSWYRNPVSIYTLPANAQFEYTVLKGKYMEANFPFETLDIHKDDHGNYVIENNIWTRYLAKYINGLPAEHPLHQLPAGPLKLESIAQYLGKVEVLDLLPNEQYDDLLCSNVVFLHLIDASAINTLIECIVRATPLVINRIEPTEEALGVDYPLFFTDLAEVPSLLSNEKILAAHEYLKNKVDLEAYRLETFIHDFFHSRIYEGL